MFKLIVGIFKFLGSLLTWLNSVLSELNKFLEEYNESNRIPAAFLEWNLSFSRSNIDHKTIRDFVKIELELYRVLIKGSISIHEKNIEVLNFSRENESCHNLVYAYYLGKGAEGGLDKISIVNLFDRIIKKKYPSGSLGVIDYEKIYKWEQCLYDFSFKNSKFFESELLAAIKLLNSELNSVNALIDKININKNRECLSKIKALDLI